MDLLKDVKKNRTFAMSLYALLILQEIADRVNTGNLPSDGSSQQPGPVAIVPLPQVYEFAMAAVAAQEVVVEPDSMTEDAGGGSPGLFPTTYYLSVAVVCCIAAIMHLA